MNGLKQLALRWVAAEAWKRERKTGNEEVLDVGKDSHWNCSDLLRSPAPVGLHGIVAWLTCWLISASSVVPRLSLTKVWIAQNSVSLGRDFEMVLTDQGWDLLLTGLMKRKI